jgi:hypothetical protein
MKRRTIYIKAMRDAPDPFGLADNDEPKTNYSNDPPDSDDDETILMAPPPTTMIPTTMMMTMMMLYKKNERKCSKYF